MTGKKPGAWHKRYHEDALNGYMDLSLEERGAYTTLLDLMYRDGEPVLDNERLLAGRMQVSVRKYRALRDRLLEAGKLHRTKDGKLSNRRFEQEVKKTVFESFSRVESAKIREEKKREMKKNPNQNNGAAPQPLPPEDHYARASLRDSEIEGSSDTSRSTILGARDDKKNGERSPWAFRSELEAKVDEAVGHFFRKPIILENLVNQGVSLEQDVIPTVMDVLRFKADDPPSSWSYFEKPILKAHQQRLAGKSGLNGHAKTAPVEDNTLWQKRLAKGRKDKLWHIGKWGPMPHENGCRAPPELLLPDDGRGWKDWNLGGQA